jgi:hypothetical protein
MCFDDGLWYCRWISARIPTSVFRILFFLMELFNVKVSVTLTNESRVDVARGICHSVKAELVVDSDGMPLDNDRIAVQIAESLLEEDVPSEWMFSMRAWHIRRVFLNGVSLYDHDQRYIYKAAI